MALTPYEPTTWVNDSEPDIDATNLNKIEQGIQEAIDGVNDILNSLTNQLSTDQTKFAGIAVVNALNTALTTLSNTVSTLNSNLTDTNATVAKYNIKYHYRGVIGASTILNNVSDLIALGFYGGDLSLNGSYVPPDTYNNNSYGTVHWILGTGDIAYLQFIRDRDASIITRSISRSESFDTGWIAH